MPFCHITLIALKPPDSAYPKTLETIGDHIRKKRLDLKMTAEEVGRLIGVTSDTVYRWEYHGFNPMPCRLLTVFKFLGYEPKVKLRQFCGHEIFVYRHKKGLTQKELAEYLGIHTGTLCQWEKNKKRPSQKMFAKLTSLFSDLSIFLSENSTKS